MNWVEIKIKTSTEAIEAVANLFYEAGVMGVVIEDPRIYLRPQDEAQWDYMEVPEGIDFEEAVVTGYLVEDSSLAERVREIEEGVKRLPEFGLNMGRGEMAITIISDEDWANAWKKYYKPTRIGKTLVVKPSWEEYLPQAGEVVIDLDPGMAFGTGTHETTRLCMELLEKYMKRDFSVIDIGCGSGILSIAAGKLGASRVLAIDRDEVSVKVAGENVERNNLNAVVKVIKGEGLRNISFKADIIVANIIADVIIDLSGQVPLSLKEGGVFLASGIIRDRKLSVVEALERNGFDVIEESEKGEWVALASRQAPIGN
ncbi:MAG: 50S ribosomal protein L11 methyltransferase [Tepidanaerobacteraceae bacterium]|nr:50S ribosomal protein L11 methyltransferase [Tepidanaerobacteraceae bacterium]